MIPDAERHAAHPPGASADDAATPHAPAPGNDDADATLVAGSLPTEVAALAARPAAPPPVEDDPDATLVATGPIPELVALGLVPGVPAVPVPVPAPLPQPIPAAEDDAEATLVATGPIPELVAAGLVPAAAAPEAAPVEMRPAAVVNVEPVGALLTPPAEPEPEPDAAAPAAVTGTDLDPTGGPPTHAGHAPTLPGSVASGGITTRQVGRYQIKERLGRGGMASVFRAHDPGIGRDVALKFLHASLCEDDEYRARFLREAQAAGVLSHPNIVTVHDVGEIEGRPYMAMELLDGESLSSIMDSSGPMPVREVLAIGLQVGSALDYAHARHVVHRDIKPGNIVRVKGSTTVKVLDFGIAHVESADDAQKTRIGDVLGTPQYMSPEQTAGEKLDGRSDLFSVGIMLYQMLSGQRPFVGDSLVALAYKIATAEPTPLEKLRPDVPASLRRIVERLLAKAPERRFQSGHELSEALQGVVAELAEAERHQEKPRIIPLRVKWAATMALIVAIVMGVSAAVITQRQNAAMLDQATNSGASLARFIAAQNAVAALSEDWPGVAVAIQEMMKTGDFQSITVIDRAGVVRAAADATLVDQPYRPFAGQALGTHDGGVTTQRYLVGGEPVLGFEAPMTFAGKSVGRVSLGLAERPLVRVARLSIGLMIGLVVVTVVAVGIAMFFVANWFAQPIKVLAQAMGELARGRYDHRIGLQRKDEFGLLYAAFDDMATSLENRRLPGVRPASPPTPLPPLRPDPAADTYPPTVVTRPSDGA